MKAAGITAPTSNCSGYAAFSGVPGHEFVGIVEHAPAADAHWIGRRVVGEITVGCGHCDRCRIAGRGHCDVRSVLGILGRDGAFAEYLALPSINLHTVPDSLDDLAAVFVEPTAAAYRVAEQVKIEDRTRAAVVGAGRLGVLVAQVLRERGAETVVRAKASRRSLCGESASGRGRRRLNRSRGSSISSWMRPARPRDLPWRGRWCGRAGRSF